jgi:hypothetical protein
MSRWSLYVAAKTASRLREAMFVTLPFIDEGLRGGDYRLVKGPSFAKPMIGDVLAAAYDKYTRPGLAAIRRWASEVREIAHIMEWVPFAKRRYAGGVGVFLAEGGVLSRRVSYPLADEAHRWTRSPARLYWLSPAMAEDFVPIVRSSLPELHWIRQDVVMGTMPV